MRGATAGTLTASVSGAIEFDGFLAYSIAVTAASDVDLQDIRLEIPYAPQSATYMLGLGHRGGRRPASYDWTWDVAAKNQDGAWIGGVNAGLSFSLRAENYSRPLNTNFYLQKPLYLPPSWGNGGKGGIAIREAGDQVLVRNFSGPRRIGAGETLYYDGVFIVTPFHAIDTDAQWRTRFYHRYADPETVKAEHHAWHLGCSRDFGYDAVTRQVRAVLNVQAVKKFGDDAGRPRFLPTQLRIPM